MGRHKKGFVSDDQRKAVMSQYNPPTKQSKPTPQLTYLSSPMEGGGTTPSPIPDWLREEKGVPRTEKIQEFEKPPTIGREPRKPGPKPTKSLGTTDRSLKVSMYVPSTRGKDKAISEGEFRSRIEETETFMRQTFGGTTSVRGHGTWTGDDGRPVKEEVAIVETSIRPVDYRKNKWKFIQYAKYKKGQWGQDTITVAMEDTQHHRKQEGMHFL